MGVGRPHAPAAGRAQPHQQCDQIHGTRGSQPAARGRPGGSVTVSVCDTGLGIPPESRGRSSTSSAGRSGASPAGTAGWAWGWRSAGASSSCTAARSVCIPPARRAPARPSTSRCRPCSRRPVAGSSLAAARQQDGVLVLTHRAGTGERLRDHLHQRGFEVQMALMDEPASWQSRLAAAPPSADRAGCEHRVRPGVERAQGASRANPATQGIPCSFCSHVLSPRTAARCWSWTISPSRSRWPSSRGRSTNIGCLQMPEPSPESQRVFLVVDDDPDTLEMHARIVQRHSASHRVLKARNGLEALDNPAARTR